MRIAKYSLVFIVSWTSWPAAKAQVTGDDYLKQNLIVGFLYGGRLGQNGPDLNTSPGYSIDYSYRPWRWLALEAGLVQIPRPGNRYYFGDGNFANLNDQLYLVPFGARYVWEPLRGRARWSLGAGGAYLSYHALYGGGSSAPGVQFVASGDYGLTQSGKYRIGLTGRYYYFNLGADETLRFLAIGPEFTFSFQSAKP